MDNPLLRSGIVLAGANTVGDKEATVRVDDGWVTAEEVALLNLQGTDTETSFDITYPNCSLQPFDDAATYGKSFKDRLLTIEGLDLASDGHDAVASILTGSPLNNGTPSNSSLDQFLVGLVTVVIVFLKRRRQRRAA